MTTSIRILVVDDDEASRELTRARLSKTGHVVDVAADGRAAVEMMTRESYDLVIIDIMMPVMDGYEATRAIREREDVKNGCRVVVIALTACARHEDKKKAFECGMDGYLTKPVTCEDLLAEVTEVGGRLMKMI